MRIIVELRSEHSHHNDFIARLPGQSAVLSGDGWSVPVTVAAVTARTSDGEPAEPPGGPSGPGVIFDEGTDTPFESGLAVLDNIDVNGTLVGRGPGN